MNIIRSVCQNWNISRDFLPFQLLEQQKLRKIPFLFLSKNCESECETKLYIRSCNCVMHYQPRPHPNVTICSYAHARCVKEVDREIQLKRNSTFKCNHCMSGCFAISYDTTFSTSKIFERAPFLKKYNVEIRNVAMIHTYYGKSTFRSQKREEFVGFTDFLCKKFQKLKPLTLKLIG